MTPALRLPPPPPPPVHFYWMGWATVEWILSTVSSSMKYLRSYSPIEGPWLTIWRISQVTTQWCLHTQICLEEKSSACLYIFYHFSTFRYFSAFISKVKSSITKQGRTTGPWNTLFSYQPSQIYPKKKPGKFFSNRLGAASA